MRTLWRAIGVLAVIAVLAVSFYIPRAQAAGSIPEQEPNDSCATAQRLGASSLPLTISGTLDGSSAYPYPYPYPTATPYQPAAATTATATPAPARAAAAGRRATATTTATPTMTATPTAAPGGEAPNLDFFQIVATPGSFVKIAMGGLSSGQGSLADPLLGAFDGNCGYLGAADSGGDGLDAALFAQVPASGELVIAATSCCDYSFSSGGPGAGSYTLTVSEQPTIGSISGRLIDAATQEPIVPEEGVYISLMLQQCAGSDASSCTFVGTGSPSYPAPDGTFQFVQGSYQPLTPGNYRVVAQAGGYRDLATAIFPVGANENYNLGNLAMRPPQVVSSISGSVVDASTNAPLGYVYVRLQRCNVYGYCDPINQTSSAEDGSFSFSGDIWGSPLYDDTYTVVLDHFGYDSLTTGQFTPTGGGDYTLGALKLQKIPLLGSISGRLVDAISGSPLTSDSVSYGYANLLQCDDAGNCYSSVAYSPLDADGTFRFSNADSYMFLRAGRYAVSYSAEQYIDGQSASFTVAEGEDVSLGDVPVQPYPLRLLNGASCGSIPARGGTCSYSLRLVNNQDKAVSLRAWNTLWVYAPAYSSSTFQAQDAQKVRLRPGESKLVRFEFDVPRKVAPYTSICTQFYVADDARGYYFAPTSQRYGFCVTKDGAGAFKPVRGEQERELLLRMHGVPEGQRGPR